MTHASPVTRRLAKLALLPALIAALLAAGPLDAAEAKPEAAKEKKTKTKSFSSTDGRRIH